MSFRVKSLSIFEKQAKKLNKKYPSLKSELVALVQNLQENPQQGTPVGNSCFKIRLAIKSKGKGKSGGARVITHIVVMKETVYLLSIYDKSNKDNLSDQELDLLLESIEG